MEIQLFPYGKPVVGDNLIGRKDLIKRIMMDIRSGQSLVLSAPRRFGKTSIILQVLNMIKAEGFLTSYLDLFPITNKQRLAEAIIRSVLENETSKAKQLIKCAKDRFQDFLRDAEFKLIRDEFEIVLSLGQKNIDYETLLEEALDFPEMYAKKKGKNLILALDEFGELKGLDPQIIKSMRSRFQLHQNVTYIFSGSRESVIKQLFTNKSEAFYGFGKFITLPTLDKRVLVDYLIDKFNQAGIILRNELAKKIVSSMDAHPHYTKVLANALYEIMALNNKSDIEESDIGAAYDYSLLLVSNELEETWLTLHKAPTQKDLIIFMISSEGATVYSKEALEKVADSATIYVSLKELEKKGIVKKIGKGNYKFINPFFKEYLRRIL